MQYSCQNIGIGIANLIFWPFLRIKVVNWCNNYNVVSNRSLSTLSLVDVDGFVHALPNFIVQTVDCQYLLMPLLQWRGHPFSCESDFNSAYADMHLVSRCASGICHQESPVPDMERRQGLGRSSYSNHENGNREHRYPHQISEGTHGTP